MTILYDQTLYVTLLSVIILNSNKRIFPQGRNSRGVKQTHNLLSMLTMRAAAPPVRHAPSWQVQGQLAIFAFILR